MDNIKETRLQIAVVFFFVLFFSGLFAGAIPYHETARIFPLLITGGGAFFSLLLLFRYVGQYSALKAEASEALKEGKAGESDEKGFDLRLSLSFSVPVVYLFLFWLIGYMWATIIITAAAPWVIGKLKPLAIVTTAASVLLVSWLIFYQFLSIRPYEGFLFRLISGDL